MRSKKYIALVFLLAGGLALGSSSRAEEERMRPKIPVVEPDLAFTAPSPLLGAGFRFQTVDRGERPDLFFAGVNLLLFKSASGDEGAFWSFLSPGLHYQSSIDRKLTVSLAPFAYVGRSRLAFALQLFPFDSGQKGGVVGASVGYHLF
ncbi:MAG: hypothetical protein KGQ59_00230 [Bdellovibrionales bacterium]|nr:hypothetical protein [Bdellovibrionales bacterium]